MRNREDHLILIKVTWREQSTISSPQNTHLKILHIDFNVPFTLQNSLQNTIPAYKTHFLIPEWVSNSACVLYTERIVTRRIFLFYGRRSTFSGILQFEG